MAIKTKEKELMDEIGKQIAKEIDEGILSNILVETGWTPVNFIFKNGIQAVEIQNWLYANCNGEYRRFGSDYLFKDKQDAEWFILKWL
jgi:ribonucleotide reductase beta subunit family protein with ferritin-like domain